MNFKFLFQQTGKLILSYLIEWRGFYWNLPFNRKKVFSLKILPGHTIKYSGKGDISQIIYQYQVLVKYKKSFEYSTLEMFSNFLKPGDVVIDVGANSGMYSILYSNLVGDDGKVYSFEPDPETFSLLEQNLELNNCKNVFAYNFALSDKQSIIRMVAFNPTNVKLQNGDSFKYIEEVTAGDVKAGDKVMTAYKLDDLKLDLNRLDFIKIDVEGAELLVLQGSVNTILKHKPAIVFELSGKWTKRFNYKPYQLLRFLGDLGYEMEEYDFEQWIATPVK